MDSVGFHKLPKETLMFHKICDLLNPLWIGCDISALVELLSCESLLGNFLVIAQSDMILKNYAAALASLYSVQGQVFKYFITAVKGSSGYLVCELWTFSQKTASANFLSTKNSSQRIRITVCFCSTLKSKHTTWSSERKMSLWGKSYQLTPGIVLHIVIYDVLEVNKLRSVTIFLGVLKKKFFIFFSKPRP